MTEDDFANLSIMVVDDEKDMRFIIKSVLQDMGVGNVVESEDVKHAYNTVRYAFRKVDIILCDWNLPGESGLDFLNQLRGDNCNIPFFIISGRRDSESVMLAKNATVAGYIIKPFSPAQLEVRIRSVLRRINEMKACEN